MEFLYQKNELQEKDALANTFLLTNGLGGYCSVSGVFSAPRCDQGVLVAAVKAPNARINLVHGLSEKLVWEDKEAFLSAQDFSGREENEDGYRHLRSFSYEYIPLWCYEVDGVKVARRCCMKREENTTAVLYTIENTAQVSCTMQITPLFKFAPKEEAVAQKKEFTYTDGVVEADGYSLKIRTNGNLREDTPRWQMLDYPEDAKDGRPATGWTGSCCKITMPVPAGTTAELEVVFTTEDETDSGRKILRDTLSYLQALEKDCAFTDPVARQLTLAADAYISRRDSTGGKTILAGYPLFSDWGRDTMIALSGCCLAAGRLEDTKSILRTFLAYEKDGLVPNLFPEGDNAPMYNTVDAALLLIDCVWQYVQRTGDWAFAWEAWDPMDRIITHYRKGTHHGIGMDEDGLIFAGQGLDQVTWMDVCVQGVLPTPRHGKPVEINAYWYNALRIMDIMAKTIGHDEKDYEELAELVRKSFVEQFYIPEKGYLKDVISGTDADQQIRCNQIWALSLPFTMLSLEQEKNVLDTVRRHLYTPYGLRTLSPDDPQYHGHYGGKQFDRDMAYHQGTTWVFPMGAYYRACLKVHGNSREAVQEVRQGLANLVPMLRQGCAGQLPEIYDGDQPYEGKGCFAQAWSVGEMLRVFEALRNIEEESEA